MRWTQTCRQKKLPACQLKKKLLSLAAGVAFWVSLPSAWKMALQRWQTKSHAQTKHISVAQRGSSESREKAISKSNLNQAQTLEPQESLVLRHPWGQLIKAISLIIRGVHSVARDDICSLEDLTVGLHLHSPFSWVPHLVTSVHPNQDKLLHVDEAKTWGQIMVYTCDKFCSGKIDTPPGHSHPLFCLGRPSVSQHRELCRVQSNPRSAVLLHFWHSFLSSENLAYQTWGNSFCPYPATHLSLCRASFPKLPCG